jgi:hypothetical protein
MFGITFEVLRLFVGVVLFLVRITLSLLWVVVIGILALIFNTLRSSPERRLEERVAAMYIDETGIVSCTRCKRENESSRLYCTQCGAALVPATHSRSFSQYFYSILGTIGGAVSQSPAIQKPLGVALALVLVVGIAVSCSSSRPSVGGQANAPATRVDFEVGIFNAVYTNDGNGWRTGYLTLF